MKTIEIHPVATERALDQLSAALCPTAPRSVRIYDNRGQPAPLTLAGFVVQPGRQYEIRAKLPKNGDEPLPQGARLIGPPEMVDWQKEHTEGPREAENGERWQCLRMKVRRPSVWLRVLWFLRYHTIRTGDVVVEWQDSKYPGTRTSISVPLIVRKPLFHWQLLLWFIAWLIIGMVVEGLLKLGKDGRLADISEAIRIGNLAYLLSVISVPWVGIVALGWPLIRIFWYLWTVFDRARELEAGFREKYWPDASTVMQGEAGTANI